ncbi:cytochrome P450 [Nocardia sp. BMG111209]|uniref:cytochrome P450 n=1 Tax=Nocardia sp. BMG111209 TaxID=1160137 RepID=UPI000372E2E7|nr:cytochrome P450 [Nocardia sp. BMG111209]
MTDTLVSDDAIDFDPFAAHFHEDPHPIYRRLRDEAPVYHNPRYGFYALSRYADVAPAMKDFDAYSSARGVTLEQVLAPEPPDQRIPMIIMMDPPEHTRMRKLVNKVFTPRAIAELEPMITATVREFAERLDPERFDLVEDFSTLFPIEVITTMLGVPREDRQQLRAWLAAPLERAPGQMELSEEGKAAVIESTMFYARLIAERRANPQDDMISRLIEVEVDREDGSSTRLSDREILGFAALLAGAGAETVAKVLGIATVVFADHPDQWQAMRADRSLIPGAFEELLRYDGPVQYDVRYSRRDITLHDRTIPAESPVLMLLASATRDPRSFTDAERFDITRPFTGNNLGLGYGIHRCLGAALARLEGRIALDAMLDLMPEYELDRSGLRRAHVTSVGGWTNVPVRVHR